MKKFLISIAACAFLGAIGSAVAGGDPAAGKAKSATCAGCHGTDGISLVPNYPNLAGQKEAYLVKAINDYKSGARNDATMNPMVAPLSDTDIANLAAYFSSLK